jgi:hypothetical protein
MICQFFSGGCSCLRHQIQPFLGRPLSTTLLRAFELLTCLAGVDRCVLGHTLNGD